MSQNDACLNIGGNCEHLNDVTLVVDIKSKFSFVLNQIVQINKFHNPSSKPSLKSDEVFKAAEELLKIGN